LIIPCQVTGLTLKGKQQIKELEKIAIAAEKAAEKEEKDAEQIADKARGLEEAARSKEVSSYISRSQ
jgi:hypothetical protein